MVQMSSILPGGLKDCFEMAVMVISRKLPPCAASFLNFCLTLRKLGRLVNHACPKALGPGLIHGHSLAETHSFTLMKIIVWFSLCDHCADFLKSLWPTNPLGTASFLALPCPPLSSPDCSKDPNTSEVHFHTDLHESLWEGDTWT